jgi:hypothetical protein
MHSSDSSPDAWPRLVERFLASPHYGERRGQHWLDLVRFAESDGFEYDNHRPDAWRYRDYVIRSFNDDKPYDRFVLEQLAGDEIAPGDQEMRVAAGFDRLAPLRLNAGNQEVASSRNEVLTEMTTSWAPLSLGSPSAARVATITSSTRFVRPTTTAFRATCGDAWRRRPLASTQEQAAWRAKADAVKAGCRLSAKR